MLQLDPAAADEASDKNIAILIEKFSQLKHNVENIGTDLHRLDRTNEHFPPKGFKKALEEAVAKYGDVATAFNALIDRVTAEVTSQTSISVQDYDTSLTGVQNRYNELASAYKAVKGHSIQTASMGAVFEVLYDLGKKAWEWLSNSQNKANLDKLKTLKIVPYVALS